MFFTDAEFFKIDDQVSRSRKNSLRTLPFDFPHGSISLRMTLSNVEEVRVVRLPFEGLRAVS